MIPRKFRGVQATVTPDSRFVDIFRAVHRRKHYNRKSAQLVRTRQRVTRVR